jgi:hypothetical protein
MNAAFTICSNNYLAHALTLAESVRVHAPDWSFYIGLVDTPVTIPGVSIPAGITVIPVSELALPDLPGMTVRYNIIELCTAVKPSYFRKLFRDYPEIEQLHYLDPDTVLFSDPAPLQLRSGDSIQLTPHHFTPIPLDGLFPSETLTLNHGIFNLGYLGLKRSPVADTLLRWWEERMRDLCVIDLINGLFVDQLWFNFVPIYFKEVHILKHPGVNTAFWNLHERIVTSDKQVLFSGETHPLVLYHFSGFSAARPGSVTRGKVRQDVEQQPGLSPLLSNYAQKLRDHGVESAKTVESVYSITRRHYIEMKARAFDKKHPWRRLFRNLKQSIPTSVKKILRS